MNIRSSRLVLALITLLACNICVAGLFFITIPKDNRDLINIALGAMLGMTGTVLSFYFGDINRPDRKGDPDE